MSKCRVAMREGRIAIIIQENKRPSNYVTIRTVSVSPEQTVIVLEKSELGRGIVGTKYSKNEWMYECKRTDKSRVTFGTTDSEMEILENGDIKIFTNMPFSPVRAKRGFSGNIRRTSPAIKTQPTLPIQTNNQDYSDFDYSSLRKLVKAINILKDEMGNDLCLTITDKGRLSALMEIE